MVCPTSCACDDGEQLKGLARYGGNPILCNILLIKAGFELFFDKPSSLAMSPSDTKDCW
jgi:hypothetical protein